MCLRTSTHREGLACTDPVVGIPHIRAKGGIAYLSFQLLGRLTEAGGCSDPGVQARVGHTKKCQKE